MSSSPEVDTPAPPPPSGAGAFRGPGGTAWPPAATSPRRRRWLRWLGLLGGISLLGLLLHELGPRKVLDVLVVFPPSAFLSLILIQTVALACSAAALRVFLPEHSWRTLYVLNSRAGLLSTVAPSGVAEGGLVYLLRKSGLEWRRAGGGVLRDRIVSAFVVALAALAGISTLGLLPPSLSGPFPFILTACCLTFLGVGIARRFDSAPATDWLANLALTLVRSLVWGVSFLTAFRAAGAVAGTYIDFVVFPVGLRVLGILPIPGGVGISEGSLAVVLMLRGIEPSVTVAAYLVMRVAVFLGTACVALLPVSSAPPAFNKGVGEGKKA